MLSVFSYYVKTPFASTLFIDTILIYFLLERCSFSYKNVYHLEGKTLFGSRKAPEKSVAYGNSFSYFIFFLDTAEPHGRSFHVSVSTDPDSD